jgi:drug/metabolite transporter (DMT)-like permease
MSRRGWIAFAALSVIWGVPYLFIKVAVDDGVAPFFLSWARLVLGAALLFALVPRQGLRDDPPRTPRLDPRLRDR